MRKTPNFGTAVAFNLIWSLQIERISRPGLAEIFGKFSPLSERAIDGAIEELIARGEATPAGIVDGETMLNIRPAGNRYATNGLPA